LLFIGTNNYQAGVTGGEVAVKHLKSKGDVMVFTMPNQANLKERLEGYKSVFASYPQIKIVEVVDVHGERPTQRKSEKRAMRFTAGLMRFPDVLEAVRRNRPRGAWSDQPPRSAGRLAGLAGAGVDVGRLAPG